MENNQVHNTIIIGSGPAGLTAALYTARADLKPKVLAGLTPGGQLMQTTEVENFPGFPQGILGPQLMENMMEQVKRFGAEIKQENVVGADFSQQPLIVRTDQGEYRTKTVIIATGAEANWLNLPGEQRLRGHGVSACATCDGFFYKGKDVAVIGGGDSAMEEANFLTRFANNVTIVHRRPEFRASKIMLKRSQDNPKIKFLTDVAVVDVMGKDAVESLQVKHNVTGQVTDIAVQGVFLAIGHTPSAKIFAGAGVKTDAKGYIEVLNNTQTNIPGVFVAGDVRDCRYRQAVSAAGMGCMAALDVEKYLEQTES
jgi:thioredoxin reductase (NADPH)